MIWMVEFYGENPENLKEERETMYEKGISKIIFFHRVFNRKRMDKLS